MGELVQAGCITFVPNGGGQMEIVNHPELIYGNDDDAVQKIVAVLENPPLQEALRSTLLKARRGSPRRVRGENPSRRPRVSGSGPERMKRVFWLERLRHIHGAGLDADPPGGGWD